MVRPPSRASLTTMPSSRETTPWPASHPNGSKLWSFGLFGGRNDH